MGQRSTVEGARIFSSELDRMRFATGVIPGTAAATLSYTMPSVLYCNPTATRILTLPAVTAGTDEGKFFIIYNGAASGSGFDLTINNSAASTIGTLAPLEAALVIVLNGAFIVVMVGLNT